MVSLVQDQNQPVAGVPGAQSRQPGQPVQGGQVGNRLGARAENFNKYPPKKMVALYDYDPQELSPNVDAEMELSFTTGKIV